MARRRGVLLFGLLGVLLLTAYPAGATEGNLIVSSDTTLTEDHKGTIEVTADEVTLDCDGLKVTGDGTAVGITVTGSSVGVVNCSLFGFDTGIVTNGTDATLEANTVAESRLGFAIHGDRASVVDNIALEAEEVGFWISASGSTGLTGNLADGSGVGFLAEDVLRGPWFTRNQALDSVSHGFDLQGTYQSDLTENLAMYGGGDGFHLSGVEAAGLRYNYSIRNAGNGFSDDGTTGYATIGPDVGLPPPTNVYWHRYVPPLDTGGWRSWPTNLPLQNGPTGLDGNGGFIDDDGNTFEVDIEWLAWSQITAGCNPPENWEFCPEEFVTRGQMAAFLVRALGYTDDGGGDLFIDDDGNTFEADIDKLATAGVTKGCNPPMNNQYCPDDLVTRGQMAAFLVRALGYTDDGGGDLFIDDDGNTFEADIDKLGTAGVTKGCNPPTNDQFCPNDYVTRGQMAAFLRRALDS